MSQVDNIAFLRSRVLSNLPRQPSINEPQFQNVSIITALNSVKDKINRLGSLRFATETGQKLTHFYSINMVSSKKPLLLPKAIVDQLAGGEQSNTTNFPRISKGHFGNNHAVQI